MIISQLVAFFTLNRPAVQDKLFGKFFDKVFADKNVKHLITSIRNATSGNSTAVKKFTKAEVEAEIEKVKKNSKEIFKFITSLIASTTIAKRIVVPFIATPTADWAQEKFIDKSMKKSAKDDTDVDEEDADDNKEKIQVNSVATEVKEPEFKGNLLDKYRNK